MRLSQHSRESIVKEAIAKAFDAKKARNTKEFEEVGRDAYNLTFPGASLTVVKTLPKLWLKKSSDLNFKFNETWAQIHLTEAVIVPPGKDGYCLGIITDKSLVRRFENAQEASRKNKEESNKVKRELTALLNSVNTLKQLKEVWPEGKEFYGFLEGNKGSRNLPAIQFSTVNAALGIV